jgi:hypothetical protein
MTRGKGAELDMVNKDYGAPFPTMTIIPNMELSIIFLPLENI